jgi:hypothetical protein
MNILAIERHISAERSSSCCASAVVWENDNRESGVFSAVAALVEMVFVASGAG